MESQAKTILLRYLAYAEVNSAQLCSIPGHGTALQKPWVYKKGDALYSSWFKCAGTGR